MKNQWKWAILLLLGIPLSAGAQGTGSASQAELIGALLARIQKLESRVAELENRPGVSRPASHVMLASMESAIPAGAGLESPPTSAQTLPGQEAVVEPSYPSL